MPPSLLGLPAELRLLVYDYCVPVDSPLFIHPRVWLGLLNSCRTIKAELEPELCRSISHCVETIAASIRRLDDEIVYTPPVTVAGWLNLRVSRPKIKNMFTNDDPFLKFKYFHFHTFTITFHNDSSGYEYYRERPDTYQTAASNLATEIGRCYSWEAYPAMQYWVLDWSAYPQFKQRNMDDGLYACKRDAWEMHKYYNAQHYLVGVCFYRSPKAAARKRRLEERERRREQTDRTVTTDTARVTEQGNRTFFLD